MVVRGPRTNFKSKKTFIIWTRKKVISGSGRGMKLRLRDSKGLVSETLVIWTIRTLVVIDVIIWAKVEGREGSTSTSVSVFPPTSPRLVGTDVVA